MANPSSRNSHPGRAGGLLHLMRERCARRVPTTSPRRCGGTAVPVVLPSDGEVARILAHALRAAKKDWADLDEARPGCDFEELVSRALEGAPGLRRGSGSSRSPCADTAVQVRREGPGGPIPPPLPRRRPLRVLAPQGHRLLPHRRSPGVSPRRRSPPSEASPHFVPATVPCTSTRAVAALHPGPSDHTSSRARCVVDANGKYAARKAATGPRGLWAHLSQRWNTWSLRSDLK